MKIGSSAELFDGKADYFNREQRMLQPNCGQNLYLRSLANAAAMAPAMARWSACPDGLRAPACAPLASHAEADALACKVHLENPDLDDVAHLHHITRIGHAPIG